MKKEYMVDNSTVEEISEGQLEELLKELQLETDGIEFKEEEEPETESAPVQYFTSPMGLIDEDLVQIQESAEFQQGMNDALRVSGFYTLLVNSGFSVNATEQLMKTYFSAYLESIENDKAIKAQLQLKDKDIELIEKQLELKQIVEDSLSV